MNELMLFTDGSVNTKSGIGYGAYLAVSENDVALDALKRRVKIQRFEQTSSTQLELQTLLWALNDIETADRKVIVFTDSQNILGLPARRDRLEQSDYRSQKNRRINNYALYQAFFRAIDGLDCEWVKVSGHQSARQKDGIDRLFGLVDRASRRAMREDSR